MEQPMKGRVCLVTGGSSGLGKETALGLAKLGATTIIVCRDQSRGENTRSEIQEKSGNPAIDVLIADLSSQKAIRHLAQMVMERYEHLHVLINNAGVALSQRKLTEDGLEYTFAVNHLAYFLLTNLLLPALRASSPARIVNVSSEAQRMGTIDFADLQGEKNYAAGRAYGQSKLANIMFTYALARRLEGTGVTANCLHPGAVATNFGMETGGIFGLVARMARPFERTPEKGAQTSLYLASSPEVEGVNGKYFVDCKAKASSKQSYDEALQERLWQISEALTGLASTSAVS